MKQINLLFRKVCKGDAWYQYLIAIYTKLLPLNWLSKGLYSHTEIEFVERKECFSSANKGKFLGVRFDKTANVVKDPAKWDKIVLFIGHTEEQKLYDACKRKEGLKYDWLGVFGFIFPVGIEDKDRYYCSEICMDRMAEVGLYPTRHRIISPLRWSHKASRYFKKDIITYRKFV
jgi:hypothetical protein